MAYGLAGGLAQGFNNGLQIAQTFRDMRKDREDRENERALQAGLGELDYSTPDYIPQAAALYAQYGDPEKGLDLRLKQAELEADRAVNQAKIGAYTASAEYDRARALGVGRPEPMSVLDQQRLLQMQRDQQLMAYMPQIMAIEDPRERQRALMGVHALVGDSETFTTLMTDFNESEAERYKAEQMNIMLSNDVPVLIDNIYNPAPDGMTAGNYRFDQANGQWVVDRWPDDNPDEIQTIPLGRTPEEVKIYLATQAYGAQFGQALRANMIERAKQFAPSISPYDAATIDDRIQERAEVLITEGAYSEPEAYALAREEVLAGMRDVEQQRLGLGGLGGAPARPGFDLDGGAAAFDRFLRENP